MTMIARVDDHSQNLLHKSNLMQTETVWQKMQKGTALQKDSEDTVRKLNALGIETEPIRCDTFTGEKMTFFHDPDGLPIEIHE